MRDDRGRGVELARRRAAPLRRHLPRLLSASLHELLAEARDLGFLGAGPVETHLEHARAFAAAVESARPDGPPQVVVDLGSGAGIPGLVLAERWQGAQLLLLDAHHRKAEFLEQALGALGLTSRVRVAAERAESLGRDPARRGSADLVTARGFGPPAVVAECAAPFLEVGGMLAVSEPPADSAGRTARWPAEGLATLGMGEAVPVRTGYQFVLIAQERPCPDRYPRRVGVPGKRPLF